MATHGPELAPGPSWAGYVSLFCVGYFFLFEIAGILQDNPRQPEASPYTKKSYINAINCFLLYAFHDTK